MQIGTVSTSLTKEERRVARALLLETGAGLLEAGRGLTATQWVFRPDPAQWSPAEILGHLVKSETVVLDLIVEELVQRPARPAGQRSGFRDIALILAVTNRDVRFKATEVVLPDGAIPPDGALLEEFDRARRRTTTYVQTTLDDLRGRTAEHPVLGVIDAYQWILFVAAHTGRHTAQLLEVIRHPDFPSA